jgi:hypothetical protein
MPNNTCGIMITESPNHLQFAFFGTKKQITLSIFRTNPKQFQRRARSTSGAADLQEPNFLRECLVMLFGTAP